MPRRTFQRFGSASLKRAGRKHTHSPFHTGLSPSIARRARRTNAPRRWFLVHERSRIVPVKLLMRIGDGEDMRNSFRQLSQRYGLTEFPGAFGRESVNPEAE